MPQCFQQLGGGLHFTVRSQVLGHPNQVGRETLGTQVVKTLSDDAQAIIDVGPIGAPALFTSRLTGQTPPHQPDQCLAVKFGDHFHLIQELPTFFAVRFHIARLHSA